MKSYFENPVLEVQKFEVEDIMTTSPVSPGNDQLPDDEL